MNTETQLDKIRKLIDTQIETIAKLQVSATQEELMQAIINLRNLGALRTDNFDS